MTDPACQETGSGLRAVPGSGTPVIAIAAGGAGAGATSVAVNLAVTLAGHGWHTCLVDSGDAAGALLGLDSAGGLDAVLAGDCPLADAIVAGPRGLGLLAGAAVLGRAVPADGHEALARALGLLEDDYSLVLVELGTSAADTAAWAQAHLRILVTTPAAEDWDALAALVRSVAGDAAATAVVINRALGPREGLAAFEALERAVIGNGPLHYLGCVVSDRTAEAAARLHRPVVVLKHDAPSSHGYYDLAGAVQRHLAGRLPARRFSDAWRPQPPPEPAAAPPAPPAQYGQPPATDEPLAQAMANLERAVAGGALDEAATAALIERLLEAGLRRHGRYPIGVPRLLQEALDRGALSERELRVLVEALESARRGYEAARQASAGAWPTERGGAPDPGPADR